MVKYLALCGLMAAVLVVGGCQDGPATSTAPRRVAAQPTRRERPSPEPVKQIDRKPPSSLTEEADRLYLTGDYEQAWDRYIKAIQARGSDLDAHDGLSRCTAALNRPDQGCRFYEKRLKTRPKNPNLLYGAARMYLTNGDRQLASTVAYRSLRFNRNLARSYYLIALMQLTDSIPRYKSATRAFEQTLERDPSYGPAYYQLARLYAGVNRKPTRARDMSLKALKYLRPVEKDVRYETQILLGALYAGADDNQRALDVFQQALSDHGKRVYERVDVGLVLTRLGKPQDARREWETVVKEFGLAHPTGIKAYRQLHRDQPEYVDHSAFLPRSATKSDYRDLVAHLGQTGSVRAVAVPEALKAALDEYRTVVFCKSVDLNNDGTNETIVVDVRPKQDIGRQLTGKRAPNLKRHWLLSSPNLHVFTNRAGMIGTYSSHMEHFNSVDVLDLNADGIKEIVLTEFASGNLLNVVVFAKRDIHYRPVLVIPVECADDSCGVLLADLDADGKCELMTVSGDVPWVDIYRYTPEGSFAECHKDFPNFYRDYLTRHAGASDKLLDAHPMMRERLNKARTFLAADLEPRDDGEPVQTSLPVPLGTKDGQTDQKGQP